MKRKKFRAKTEDFISHATRTPLGTILRHGLWRDSGGPSSGRRFTKYFCFVYTLAGETIYEDEVIGARKLVPGDLLLIHPGIGHRYGNSGRGGWDEYFVLFEGRVFDLWKQQKLFNPQRPIIHLEPINHWQKRLAQCVEGPERSDLASNLQRVVALQGFMTEVMRAQSAPAHPNLWIERACQRLGSNLDETIDWIEFSRSFGLSPDAFRKMFTQTVGVTPYRYRSGRVIDRACQLSVEEHMLGKEIARELGFATEQHFSRRFKEITGLTLGQFRKQWRGSATSIVPK